MKKYFVTGYKLGSKEDKRYCIIHCTSDGPEGFVGKITNTYFLPPYLIDKVSEFVGKNVVIQFQKYNDKYSVSNVCVVD